jgi:Arc/MetJ-type ribon-helix-helix transcriptional regulator
MGELVHLRLDSKMRAEIKSVVKENLFANETEFIRESVRRNIELYKKLQVIHALRGSLTMKKGKGLNSSEVFRAFGLEE